MTRFADYEKYDGLGLAELVRKKEVTPLELCEEAILRIDRINPKINAVIYRMDDMARAAATGPIPQGPFSGVPFLCKDLVSAIAGVPMTRGSKSCRNHVPMVDSEMARRHKAAGLIVLGKTNTPEFGLMGVTEPELHGPTRNPWNPGIRIIRPAVPAAVRERRLPPVLFPWPQAATGADRSAFPHRAARCSV